MGKMSESMTKKGRNQNIQVFVRLRPINSREKEIKSCSVVETCGNREVVIRQTPLDCKQTKKFTFDRVFGPSSTQLEVYKNVVSPLIEEVLSGYSCTVFAYGQTGTGKTFTMAGAPATTHDKLSTSGGPSWRSDPLTGIIPRALNQLFDELRLAQMEFTIRVSYLELYNEELFDLLAPTIEQSSSKIRIYDDPTKKGSVIVQGLEEIPVQSKGEVYKILEDGQEKRKTASTLMNAQSSRSHTVFSILVHIKETNMQGEAMLKTGKLNLVDLAGSENISKAGNDKKERARETVNINQSLLTLGRVISALVDRTPHIPYRESKLTRLLQDSLGGRTKTSIIATISPGHKDLDETMSTLDYAHRAKNIMNKPEINQKLTQKLAIKGYTDEIDRLRKELYSQREKSGVFLPNEKYEDMILKLNHQDQEIADNLQKLRAIEEERNKIMAIYENSRCTLRATKSKLNATKNTLDEVQKKYKETKKVLKKTENVAEEKSHIIEVQANTEKLLSSQALDLINVAEITTEETEKLQNVLEQRRKIDHMIKSSAELFNDRMKQSIGSIKNSVQQCYEDCNNKNYLVNSNIAKLYHANIEAYNDSTETTNETFSYIQSILEMLNKLALSSNSKMSDGLRSSFEYNSNKIEEARLDITSNSTDVFRFLLEEMNEIFGKRTGLVSSIYENMKSKVSKNKELIDNYVSKEQPIEIKETFEEMFSFMEKLNGKIGDQDASESLSKFLEEYKPRVASLLKQKQENSEQMSSLYSSNYDSCCEYMKKFTNNVTDLNDQQKKIMENVAKEVNRVVEKVDSVLTSVREGNSAVHKDLANVVNISRKDHSSQYDTCRDVLERKLADHVILLKAQSDMVGQHTEDFLLRNEELSKMIRELSKLVDSSLDDIVSDIGKYCSEELEVYRPTGETPVRKTHSFSRVLASTSPHERILQRFRQERGYILHQESWDNNSIIEIDESDEEDETTMVSINIPDGVEPLEHKLTSKWPSETDISKPLREEISPTRFKLTKSASAIEFRESDAHERAGKENVPVERPKSATKYDRHLSSIPVQRRDPARVLNMKNK